jgi:hypothetical protein
MGSPVMAMNFESALKICKGGHCIRRQAWPEITHVYLEEGYSMNMHGYERKYGDAFYVYQETSPGNGFHRAGWQPTAADMLADDWEIVGEASYPVR